MSSATNCQDNGPLAQPADPHWSLERENETLLAMLDQMVLHDLAALEKEIQEK